MIAYLDANIVIDFIEQPAVWGTKVTAHLARLRGAGAELATSDASRFECLVVPYRNGDAALPAAYAAFFSDPALRVFPLTATVCERAARIRAQHRLKPPDALHLAAAVEHGCDEFVTNDLQLASFPDLRVDVLT
jgi:predicted nucleic acid-binding protein